MAEYTLHCFAESGNAYKAALMLQLTGQDWVPVFVDFFHGQTRGQDWRDAVNEQGEVPVLEHAGEKLTQSALILDYLAERTGQAAYQIVDAHLAKTPFMVGGRLTIADLSLAGYVYMPEDTGLAVAEFGHIEAWKQRIQDMPGWKHPYDLMPNAAG
ncbi:hypothetical protein WR25_23505 [Diploscapter pachys]|uniref:Glutathione S-transferase n=1 Tax=Diploscapter pachys TaxID=2018661 RepID=A0A2A2K8Y3_9BILA|nr:hypothetical protein WR25_23505 [Diploscapter pachys]